MLLEAAREVLFQVASNGGFHVRHVTSTVAAEFFVCCLDPCVLFVVKEVNGEPPSDGHVPEPNERGVKPLRILSGET